MSATMVFLFTTERSRCFKRIASVLAKFLGPVVEFSKKIYLMKLSVFASRFIKYVSTRRYFYE